MNTKHILTTIFGLVGAAGTYLVNAAPSGIEHTIGQLLATAGTLLLGIFAADARSTATK
jgi:hypothetical protein